MSEKLQRGGSFRLRMVLFSTLVAAVGLLVFALLAIGFYQRDLRKNLEADLRALLQRTAPVILRLSETSLSPRESRLPGVVLGRLEQLGAGYAVQRAGPEWIFGPRWPDPRESLLNRLVRDLPVSTMRTAGRGPGAADSRRGAFRERPLGAGVRSSVRLISSADLPRGWIYAGLASEQGAVLLAVPGPMEQAQMRRLVAVLGMVVPFALGLVALCAWFFSSRAITPIRKLTRVASATSAEDLSRRIDRVGMEREFQELVDVFNGMLARLERSFGQARRFGQDAAHELNTPLTILTAKVDEAIVAAPDGSSEQERLAEIADELGRLREIVRKLHLLARMDGGGLHPDASLTDLSKLVAGAVEEMKEVFPALEFIFECHESIVLLCDPSLVRQIVLNLLNNAGSYNREQGRVLVKLIGSEDSVRLSVTNTGPGIPESLRDRIFDRFTRGDASRPGQRGGGGLGLGLSLAREFARVHRGDLLLESAEEDRVCFTFIAPRIAGSMGTVRSGGKDADRI